MRATVFGKQQKIDYSRFIFAMLVLSMLAVGGFLAAINDNDQAAQGQVSAVSNSSRLAATSPITASIPPTLPGKIAFTDDLRDGAAHIYTFNPDGTGLFTVTNDYAYNPTWSSDGRKIVYSSFNASTFKPEIATINADGSDPQILVTSQDGSSNSNPSWSPDGTRIVFGRYTSLERESIFTVDADGNNLRRLTESLNNRVDISPDWSPDGTQIAFVRQDIPSGGDYDIYLMNADGSNVHNITPDIEHALEPNWSPDGTKIAFTSGLQVHVMNADGSNPHPIPNLPFQEHYEPSWSPDGNWIVFHAEDQGPPLQAGYHLYLAKVDGSEIYTLTTGLVEPGNWGQASPDWGATKTVVQVKGEDGLPVPGAEVYQNCTLLGTTSITGTMVLTSPLSIDDELIARAAVYTGTTQKAGHEGWAYQVWLTNIIQNNDGLEAAYVVTNTSLTTHTLTILPTNAQIGFNIVASVEYNTTEEHLGQIESGFVQASDYLMDVTDGQMFFENVKLYEDGQHWNDADFQFHFWNPRANADAEPDGISSITSPAKHIRMDGPDDDSVPYDQYDAFSTFIHEFGHYAIGAYDEYYKWNIDDFPTSCTVNFDDVEFNERASIMYDDDSSSEFCADVAPVIHNEDTAHGYIQGESVWQTLVDNWSSEDELWELRSPMTRGGVNRGPVAPLCHVAIGINVEINPVPGGACEPLLVKAVFSDGNPAVGADITVHHNGRYFTQGQTDSVGNGYLVGAQSGETVIVGMLVNGVGFNGRATVSNCTDIVRVTLTNTLMLEAAPEGETAVLGGWPTYWLEAAPDWSANQVDIVLHVGAEPPTQPTLYASQSGANRQQVALTYNASQHNYTGTYSINPTLSPDFQFELERSVGGQPVATVHKFLGGQFHTSGPSGFEKRKNPGTMFGNDPGGLPPAWGLMRPESKADVIVNSTSLQDGTGVLVGDSGMPADRVSNLVPVGGPYSLLGQSPISEEVGITLAYLSEHYCGLVPGSTAIYRYTGTGWEVLPTTLIEDWHQAGATITQWGVYGVFAQPNPQADFSDVPAGSTFYDYINWMTCHGIAGGYSDGTFRPSNNATRGQISKMMALTYQWYLEAPENGYTFADVPQESTFHLYVEAAYREGVVSGYACGGAGEPCDGQNRPYFRPSSNVTRGQIAKIISNGSKFSDSVSGQSFEDVAVGSTFYEFVERMASRAIINGYACGGAGEPCGGGNRPFFRPQSNATRGQLSKMIYLAAQPR